MECTVRHQEIAIANINRVKVSGEDMQAVAEATATYVELCPEAFGRPVERGLIEELFGEGSAKSLAIEARLLALRQMVKRGHAPVWLAPTVIGNPELGKALLEAAAREPLRFDGTHFRFDADRLCNRMLAMSTAAELAC